MAKKSWLERNKRKKETVKKYAALRAELKAKRDYAGLAKLPRNASPTRVVNRCAMSGRRRGYLRKFGCFPLDVPRSRVERLDSRRDQSQLVKFLMSDPISDMLTRIRNGGRALLPAIELPHSRIKESIAKILKSEGYVAEVAVEGKTTKKIKIHLKYNGKKSVIEGLQARQQARFAQIRRRDGNSPRARRPGRGDRLHLRRRDDRTRRRARKTSAANCSATSGNLNFMSRIGKQPIAIPPKVKVEVKGPESFRRRPERQARLGIAPPHQPEGGRRQDRRQPRRRRRAGQGAARLEPRARQ